MEGSRPPYAAGLRPDWPEVSGRVRAAVEDWLGSPVVSAASQSAGFSPGVAARLQTEDGRRVFAKAAGPEPNPLTPVAHRREARITSALPVEVPVPRLLWSHARVGAPRVDVVFFAPSVAMQGGPPPEELLSHHPHARRADPEAVTAVIAAVAGFFTGEGLRPAPPGLTTLRKFQAAQGELARGWLARRTGWG